jgi:hypothetical protein
MSTEGRKPVGAREHCYVCGRLDRASVLDPVPAMWTYAAGEPPARWPTAALCPRCRGDHDAGDRALRGFVASRIAAGSASGLDGGGWSEAPPRAVRDGLDHLVRALHAVLLGECVPTATTLVTAEAPSGGLGAGPIDAYEIGPDFRVEHAVVRSHHRWRITFFGAVEFHVVTCPPLSEALRFAAAEADGKHALA